MVLECGVRVDMGWVECGGDIEREYGVRVDVA